MGPRDPERDTEMHTGTAGDPRQAHARETPPELRPVFRRRLQPPPPREPLQPREPLRHGNMEVRPDEYQVLIEGRRIALTLREFEVLLMLAEHPDRVVRREAIYETIWGGEMKYRERAVDVFVRKIRTKLSAAAPDWVYIHTHFGIGYRFAPEERRFGAASHTVPPPGRR